MRARDYGGYGGWSLAASPKGLIENPEGRGAARPSDVLSSVLNSIRLSGSLQFCFMPTGTWQTPGRIPLAGTRTTVMPFHVLVAGTCWMTAGDKKWNLEEGDVVALPFDSGHMLGAGPGGRVISPRHDFRPSRGCNLQFCAMATMIAGVRLLCGYLQCDALSFRPLQARCRRSFMSGREVRTPRLAAGSDRANDRGSGYATQRRALHVGTAR